MAVTFKGFHSPIVGKTITLYDYQLVRQDLINHFNTKKGERAFDAEYGFIGWDLLFELDNFNLKNILEADCRRIVSLDPRLRLQSISIVTFDYGYEIKMILEYVVLNKLEELTVVFDNRSTERMSTYNASML